MSLKLTCMHQEKNITPKDVLGLEYMLVRRATTPPNPITRASKRNPGTAYAAYPVEISRDASQNDTPSGQQVRHHA